MLKKSTLFTLYFCSLLLLGIIHFSKDPDFSFLHLAVHIPAILGVISIFFAILTPLLKKRITGLKPGSIISIHHLFSYLGWSAVLVHMVFLFVRIKKFTLFIPAFSDWATVLSKSGPIAVILIILGSLGLLFRKQWRTFQVIHSINIIAFFWITLHGIVKDHALEKNLVYFYLLLLMDITVVGLLLSNWFQNKQKKKLG